MLKIIHLVFYYSKPTLIFYLAFFLVNSSAIGQSKQAYDWEEKFLNAKGQDRIDLIVKFTKDFAKDDLSMADSLAREGIDLARQLGDSLSVHRLGSHLGRIYYYQDEMEKGFKWTRQSLNYFDRDKELAFDKAKTQLNLAELHIKRRGFQKADSLIVESTSYFTSINDRRWQGKIAYAKGMMNYDKREFEQALAYFSEALSIGNQVEDIELIAMAMTSISIINERYGFFPEALDMQFQVFSMDCSKLVKAAGYSNIGYIYHSLEDWEPAMKYLHMGLDLEKKIGLKNGIWRSLTNLGIAHKKQMNFGEAMKCFEQSLEIQKECKFYPGSLLGTMGNIYNQLGHPEKANKYFDEYMELAQANNDWEGIWGIHYNRGYYHFHIKQYDEALKLFLKSYEIAKEKNNLRIIKLNNELLSKVFRQLGNEEKAKFHQEQYSMFDNNVNSAPRERIIKALEQMHLSELQKDSLQTFAQKNNSLSPHQKSWSRPNRLIGLAFLFLLTGLSFLIYKKYRRAETVPSENKPIDQTKIDRYFEELFARLDQKGGIAGVEENHTPSGNVAPIHDMAEFLKSNLTTANEWIAFEQYFEKIHKDFFKKLKSTYPTITSNEMNMCALLKLNLLNKDIAQIMGISPDSVRKAQNRLSKKIGLPSGEILRGFVLKL